MSLLLDLQSSLTQSRWTVPEKLAFRDPHDWRRCIFRWEQYRISSMHLQDQGTQVNTFIYAIGKEAEDVLLALRLTEDELKTYVTVRNKFESHFVPHRNIIYERAKFSIKKNRSHIRRRIYVYHRSPQVGRCM